MPNKKVTILDYGMANLLNVARAFEHCGASVTIAETAEEALNAERLIVPGVGAFEHALKEIRQKGYDDTIARFVDSEKPMLGICVGMQMLFDSSDEFGSHSGLGILPGKVTKIPNTTVLGSQLRVPHIGWNHLVAPLKSRERAHRVVDSFPSPAFYFVHSYSAAPLDSDDRVADCLYGEHRICAIVQRGNVTATQFHPERSGKAGLDFLKTFLSW